MAIATARCACAHHSDHQLPHGERDVAGLQVWERWLCVVTPRIEACAMTATPTPRGSERAPRSSIGKKPAKVSGTTAHQKKRQRDASATTEQTIGAAGSRCVGDRWRRRWHAGLRRPCALVAASICAGIVLLIVYHTAGCGGSPCGPHGSCAGLIAECTCMENYAGEFCEEACGGASDAAAGSWSFEARANLSDTDSTDTSADDSRACECSGTFVGPYCRENCNCNGHGDQLGLAAALEAGNCAAGSCRCSGNWIGKFCETECGCGGNGQQTAIESARAADNCGGGNCTCNSSHTGRFCEVPKVALLRLRDSEASRTCAAAGRRVPSSRAECEAAARVWSEFQCNPGYAGPPDQDFLHCRRVRYAVDLGSEESVWSNNDCWGQLYPRCAFFHNYNVDDDDGGDMTGTRLHWAPRCQDNALLYRNPVGGTGGSGGEYEVLCV